MEVEENEKDYRDGVHTPTTRWGATPPVNMEPGGRVETLVFGIARAVIPPSLALTFIRTFAAYWGLLAMQCLDWSTCEGTPYRQSQDFLMRRYTKESLSPTIKRRSCGSPG